VARTDENILVGIVNGMTDGEVTYLTDLYVEPRYQRRGYGTGLMNQFLELAKGTTIVLLTAEATEFYRRFGFTERTAMVRRAE
jgi:GNAT superfamily N-acetyltransferase